MRLVKDEQLVEVFFAHGAYPALGVRVCPRGVYRNSHNLYSFRCKYGIRNSKVLIIVIANQMGKRLPLRLYIPDDLALK